jgi:hypothetical protein
MATITESALPPSVGGTTSSPVPKSYTSAVPVRAVWRRCRDLLTRRARGVVRFWNVFRHTATVPPPQEDVATIFQDDPVTPPRRPKSLLGFAKAAFSRRKPLQPGPR